MSINFSTHQPNTQFTQEPLNSDSNLSQKTGLDPNTSSVVQENANPSIFNKTNGNVLNISRKRVDTPRAVSVKQSSFRLSLVRLKHSFNRLCECFQKIFHKSAYRKTNEILQEARGGLSENLARMKGNLVKFQRREISNPTDLQAKCKEIETISAQTSIQLESLKSKPHLATEQRETINQCINLCLQLQKESKILYDVLSQHIASTPAPADASTPTVSAEEVDLKSTLPPEVENADPKDEPLNLSSTEVEIESTTPMNIDQSEDNISLKDIPNEAPEDNIESESSSSTISDSAAPELEPDDSVAPEEGLETATIISDPEIATSTENISSTATVVPEEVPNEVPENSVEGENLFSTISNSTIPELEPDDNIAPEEGSETATIISDTEPATNAEDVASTTTVVPEEVPNEIPEDSVESENLFSTISNSTIPELEPDDNIAPEEGSETATITSDTEPATNAEDVASTTTVVPEDIPNEIPEGVIANESLPPSISNNATSGAIPTAESSVVIETPGLSPEMREQRAIDYQNLLTRSLSLLNQLDNNEGLNLSVPLETIRQAMRSLAGNIQTIAMRMQQASWNPEETDAALEQVGRQYEKLTEQMSQPDVFVPPAPQETRRGFFSRLFARRSEDPQLENTKPLFDYYTQEIGSEIEQLKGWQSMTS